MLLTLEKEQTHDTHFVPELIVLCLWFLLCFVSRCPPRASQAGSLGENWTAEVLWPICSEEVEPCQGGKSPVG